MKRIMQHLIFGILISTGTVYGCIAIARMFDFVGGENAAQAFLWVIVNVAQWIWNGINIADEVEKNG